jgi:putative DNA primase/helicase
MINLQKKFQDLCVGVKGGKYITDDNGMCRLFADLHQGILTYTKVEPSKYDWLFYENGKWNKGNSYAKRLAGEFTQAFEEYTKPLDDFPSYKLVRNYYYGLPKFGAYLNNDKRRSELLRLARWFLFEEKSDIFDNKPLFFNCQNGTLELGADEIGGVIFREHRSDDCLTQIATVKYNPAAVCPKWERAVAEILSYDENKMQLLQKSLGYAMTGLTCEDEIFMFLGASSQNGKSTIAETILYLFGDYGITLDYSEICLNGNRLYPPRIANLIGKRFALVDKNAPKRKVKTWYVKHIAENMRIRARGLHGNDVIEFSPISKLFFCGNHNMKFSCNTINDSLCSITFNEHFGEDRRDHELKDHLKDDGELSGILNWLIEGFRLWQFDRNKQWQLYKQRYGMR